MNNTYLVALSSAVLLSGVSVSPAYASGHISCLTGGSATGSFTVSGTEVISSLNCEGSAVIPAAVTAIDLSAFEDSSFLTEVTFEANSSLTTIRAQAFAATGITSFTIPSGVTTIGAQAFAGSSALTSVTFRGMSAPASVSEDAFSSIGANPKLYLEDGATGFGSVGDTWKGLLIAAGGTIVAPDPTPDPAPAPAPAPAPVSSSPAPPPLPSVASPVPAITKSFSLESPVLAKQQRKMLRTLIRQVGAGGSFEVVAGIARQEGLSKKALRALARDNAKAIKKYLVKRGIKKRDVKIKVKIYKVGASPESIPETLVLASKSKSAVLP